MGKNKKVVLKLIAGILILCTALFFLYNRTFFGLFSNSGDWAEELPVLLYHHLLREEENPYKDNSAVLTVESFQQQMELLHRKGYHTIGLDELEAFVKGEIKLPKRSVLITFDDGYKSNYEYAYPILKEIGFKAVIFLISGWNTDEIVSFNANELQYLSWNEIENSRDVFEYGSHTHDLHKLNEEEKGYLITKPLDVIKSDLKQSMDLLETTYFAYPYGHYNEQTLEILKKLGYRMAFTVETGKVRPGDNLLELNRYGIFPSTSLRTFKSIVGL